MTESFQRNSLARHTGCTNFSLCASGEILDIYRKLLSFDVSQLFCVSFFVLEKKISV